MLPMQPIGLVYVEKPGRHVATAILGHSTVDGLQHPLAVTHPL